ncbi:MAG: molybdate ABC transporter substrate-binding protein [Deltaproteobacteria bacterium]|nr:molybdate ABC transporter substrate-binding protein [Deltaproteobacteria bacterium]
MGTLVARVVLALLALPTGACGRYARTSRALSVCGASSLTSVLTAISRLWEHEGRPAVGLRFDASSRLARQLEAGARCDVFVSADTAWVEHLRGRRLLTPGPARVLARNGLVVVVSVGSPWAPASLRELAERPEGRVALAGESVPLGRYSEQALARAGLSERLRARGVRGDTARTTLGWVARGDAVAGIVYATDAQSEPSVRVALRIAADQHEPIVYPAVVTAGARDIVLAQQFVSYCASDAVRTLWSREGFLR